MRPHGNGRDQPLSVPKQMPHSCSPNFLSLLLLLLSLVLLTLQVTVTSYWSALSLSLSKPQPKLHLDPHNLHFPLKPISPNPLVPPVSSNLTKLANVTPNVDSHGPYHNWELFALDFREMIKNFKIFVYPDVHANGSDSNSSFARVFLPHPNPYDPKLGNYFSEHMFKVALMASPLLTTRPEKAQMFFMPFSINVLRNDRRVHSEHSIANFVAQYVERISRECGFWNASSGSDHFYVSCHSVGRDAASQHWGVHNNAVQLTCSSSYFQRLYVAHKDVGLPQVWPRPAEKVLNPPHARHRLAFFAGRVQNSRVREELIALWANDTSMDIFPGKPTFPYEEGFRRSKYCLHVKGYEVNTARISDAIHYGCIPVIISNYYDLPLANILNWRKFSIIIHHGDIGLLKDMLLSISQDMYLSMYRNLCQIRRHFRWHRIPRGYDSFYMTAYQLWTRRNMHGFP